MAFQSPPKQGDMLDDKGKCSPLWLKWFIDITTFVNSFVPASRTITVQTPLLIGGAASANLSADRTITVNGLSVVIVTAKLTGAGVNGSMTFVNGILTAQTPAT